jgi:hypothetical protein
MSPRPSPQPISAAVFLRLDVLVRRLGMRRPWFAAVLLLIAAAVGSCASPRARKPGYFSGASIKVRGAGVLEVQDALVETFQDHGFRLASGLGQLMTFEKEGTRNDRWMYSTRDEPQTQRLVVTLELGDDPETIRVHCSGKLVRELAHGVGEDTGYLLAGGRWRYDQLLREAKRRAERESSSL